MRIPVLLAGAALVLAAPLHASTFLRLDVPALARASESVVHARVVEVTSGWDADHSMIYTHATLQVIRNLKGAMPARVTLRVPGGAVAEQTTVMVGAPAFARGDEVVAFLSRWDEGVPGVMGYAQGLSRVRRDGAGRARLRGGAADGLTLSELAGRIGRPAR